MFILKPIYYTAFNIPSIIVTCSIYDVTGTGSLAGKIQTYNTTSNTSVDTGISVVGTASSYQAGAALNNTSFIFGGQGQGVTSPTAQITRYNGVITTLDGAQLATGINFPAASTLSSLMYIFGGNTSTPTLVDTIQSYDGTTRLTTAQVLSVAAQALCACTNSSNVFIFGGSSNAIQRYNGSTRTTDSATCVGLFRWSGAGTISTNSFVFGGENSNVLSNIIQRYNGTTRTTDSATLGLTRCLMQTASTGSNVYIIGGRPTAPTATNRIEKYDGTTVTWISSAIGTPYTGCASYINPTVGINI